MILVNLSLPISLSFTYVNLESSSPYVFDASFTVTVILFNVVLFPVLSVTSIVYVPFLGTNV